MLEKGTQGPIASVYDTEPMVNSLWANRIPYDNIPKYMTPHASTSLEAEQFSFIF